MPASLSSSVPKVDLLGTSEGGVDFVVFDPAAVLVAALGPDSPEAKWFCGSCSVGFPAQLINANSVVIDSPPSYACLDAFCISSSNLCEIFVQWLYSAWWADQTGGIESDCHGCGA